MRQLKQQIRKNNTSDLDRQILDTGKLLVTSDLGENRMSLYRKGENYFLVYFQEDEIVKTEKISRNLAHMQFPNLLVR
jgi:hypothetical protein